MSADTRGATKEEQLKELILRLAFEGSRVIHGACHVWTCRMCGGNDVNGSKDGKYHGVYAVQHADYCPVKGVL